jgi:hypothetical protein
MAVSVFGILLMILESLPLVSTISPRFENKPLISAQRGFETSQQTVVQWSNMSMMFGQFEERNLFARQGCVDSGYGTRFLWHDELLEVLLRETSGLTSVLVPCVDYAGCCPADETCQPNGCCAAGEQLCGASHCYNPDTSVCCSDGSYCLLGTTCQPNGCCPAGEEQCGTYKCYDPSYQQCCANGEGACDKDMTCCEQGCCASDATCQDDGYCSANICTETSTYRSTSWATHVTTIIKIAPPEEEEEAPELVCPPLTVTNSANATLELGDDCALTIYPAPTDGATAALLAKEARSLQPRAALDCPYTSTSIETYTVHTITTITSTATREEVSEKFSCLPMSVTNSVGDELSLNEECQLEFSPGDSAATTTSAKSSTNGSVPPSGNDEGKVSDGARLMASKAFVCLSFLSMISACLLWC